VGGFLHVASPGAFEHLLRGFRQGLNEVGVIDGQNAAIEYRWAEGHYDTCLHWQTSSFGAVYPCWWRLEEKTPKADISGIDIVTEVCAIFPSESTGSQ